MEITVEELSAGAFAPFGDVVTVEGAEMRLINGGTTRRYHDLARVAVKGEGARPLISIFRGTGFSGVLDIVLMERHPLGSQAFIPMDRQSFAVIVAPDEGGVPGRPRAFVASGGTGVNYAAGTWHHPLVSLRDGTDFVVVDRGGEGANLEEHAYPPGAYRMRLPAAR